MPDKTDEFIEALIVPIKEGFNPWAVLAHAWHESGGFRNVIGEFGFWGIKKTRDWAGKTVAVHTSEFGLILNNETETEARERLGRVFGSEIDSIVKIDNRWKIKIIQQFIDFENIGSAMVWYISLIKRLYPGAYSNRNNPEIYFQKLSDPSEKYQYATDPEYPEKLKALYSNLRERENLKNFIGSVMSRAVLNGDLNLHKNT